MKKARDEQIGGGHYKDMVIQPFEYCHRNGLGLLEGNVVKYVSRYKVKGGVEDLRKAIHCLQLLIEEEEKETPSRPSQDEIVDEFRKFFEQPNIAKTPIESPFHVTCEWEM